MHMWNLLPKILTFLYGVYLQRCVCLTLIIYQRKLYLAVADLHSKIFLHFHAVFKEKFGQKIGLGLPPVRKSWIGP